MKRVVALPCDSDLQVYFITSSFCSGFYLIVHQMCFPSISLMAVPQIVLEFSFLPTAFVTCYCSDHDWTEVTPYCLFRSPPPFFCLVTNDSDYVLTWSSVCFLLRNCYSGDLPISKFNQLIFSYWGLWISYVFCTWFIWKKATWLESCIRGYWYCWSYDSPDSYQPCSRNFVSSIFCQSSGSQQTQSTGNLLTVMQLTCVFRTHT